MCTGLPNAIRVLRLVASGLELLDPAIRDSLNALVDEWRAVRRGYAIVAGAPREAVLRTPRVSSDVTTT